MISLKNIKVKHILVIIYVYVTLLMHYQLYDYLISYKAVNPFVFFKDYFFIIIVSVPFLYLVFQWIYIKIGPKRRLLLSIGFLAFLVFTVSFFRYIVETHYHPLNVYVYRIFILAGILTAFVMGVFLDILMKGLFSGYKISFRKVESLPGIFKHFLMVVYIYSFIFIHIDVFLYYEYGIIQNPVRGDEYFYIFMFVTLLPVIILYFIYQWLYLKKMRRNGRLFSILFLELFIFLEIVLFTFRRLDKNDKADSIFLIGSGIVVAFVMGWLLDILMKKFFKDKRVNDET